MNKKQIEAVLRTLELNKWKSVRLTDIKVLTRNVTKRGEILLVSYNYMARLRYVAYIVNYKDIGHPMLCWNNAANDQ